MLRYNQTAKVVVEVVHWLQLLLNVAGNVLVCPSIYHGDISWVCYFGFFVALIVLCLCHVKNWLGGYLVLTIRMTIENTSTTSLLVYL